LTKPVEQTLYFASEAYYEGAEMGTVEAALASGEGIINQDGQENRQDGDGS